MTVRLDPPGTSDLAAAIAALRGWQDHAAFQLHPGDLGWFARFGERRMLDTVRTWSRAGRVVAVGLLDGPDLLRLAIDPGVEEDDGLARRLIADLGDPEGGVFGAGTAYLEVPAGAGIRELLAETGWKTDEPWTPLKRDLARPVERHDLRIEIVGPELAAERVALQRSAFENSTFTVEAWTAMAAGAAFADARDLIGLDSAGVPVAAITVWSAGPGLPGLIEPMGVHPDHRGRGHGRAITLAGAAALRELGASSATVCTRSSNLGAIATYRSAGMTALPERMDLAREL